MEALSSVRETFSEVELSAFTEDRREEIEEPDTTENVVTNQPQRPAANCLTFLRINLAAPAVVVAGMLCCLFVAAYTHWLSNYVLTCPEWTVHCPTFWFLTLNSDNITIVQGIATIIYSLGLAAMAYGTEYICECAIWPLLSKQHLSINQIDNYLSTVKGSVPSIIISWRMVSTNSTAFVLLISAITTVTTLVAAPLVGIVFARGDILANFQSEYPVANGIGRIYVQTNPPVATGDNSQASYVAWALNQSPEPLPEQRLWVIDRSSLFVRGSMKIRAVKAETEITCRGTNVTEISSTKQISTFSTRMAEHNWRQLNSSDRVQVQVGKAVAVWVHDFTFDHANKSSADLIFAAFNGSIENGMNTTLSNGWNVSSVICKVGVEFVDKDLDIGNSSALAINRPVLSSNVRTEAPKLGKNGTAPPTLNENALWFAVAPMLVSMCVNGSQPMFYNWDPNGTFPSAYTRAPFSSGEPNYNWTSTQVKNLIVASIGAVAQASSRNNQTEITANIVSQAITKKLYTGRAIYLLVPVIIIALGQMMLLYWNIHMHRTEKLTLMRLAGFGELLESAFTDCFLDLAHEKPKPDAPSDFGQVKVRLGWTTLLDKYVVGLAKDASLPRSGLNDESER